MTRKEFLETYTGFVEIGKGGTGVVYRAHHMNLDKPVILKRITISKSLQLVRREVDILKNLKHRYLPTIYDFIDVEGEYFLVEDFIEGYDLKSYIAGAVFVPEYYVVKWLGQMCEVLEYLHSRTPPVIHSDIKPGNIMIDKDGDVCLIDFNISVLSGDTIKVHGYSTSYCAPEQIIKFQHPESSVSIDARTDIYSLCATFYALITGVVPTPGEENPALSKLKLPYQARLTRLIDKGMSKEQSARWQSATQMRERLGKITEDKSSRKAKRAIGALSAAAVAVVIATAIWTGSYSKSVDRYKSEISAVTSKYESEGASDALAGKIRLLLADRFNNKQIERDKQKKAELYAILAENSFDPDDAKALSTALGYYDTAWAAIKDSEAANVDAVMRDYAAEYSLLKAMNGKEADADRLIKDYFDGAGGVAGRAVRIGVSYNAGDFYAVNVLASEMPDGTENKISREYIYKLAALAAAKESDTGSVLMWLNKLNALKPTDPNRRFSGALCFEAALASSDTSLYGTSADYYSKLNAPTNEDLTDHAESLLRMKKYAEALSIVPEHGNIYNNALKARINCIMARAYHGMEKTVIAENYCMKALECWKKLTPAEKERLTPYTADRLRELVDVLGIETDTAI